MAWNGSGGFQLLYSWVSRRDAGSPTNLIGATEMDAEMANLKNGLENCVTRDGQNAASANLPMGGYKHTGVAAAASLTDYARAGEVQKGTIWKAASPGGTIDAMTGTVTPTPTLTAGMLISIIAPGTGSNTVTNPTITLNGGSAVTIKKHQGALVVGDYTAGDQLLLLYDGTYAELLNPKYAVADTAHSNFTTDSTGGALDDLIPFIDTSDSSADNKVAVSDFFKNVYANVTAKTTPIAADSVMISDSAASGAVKRSTWTEVFTNLLAVFTAKSTPILADTVMIADSAASGAPKISTWQQVFNALSTATAKTSLASGDKLYMGDSAASDVAKHITWSNLKTQLQTDLTAAQSDMEGEVGSSWVRASRVRYHPGVAKCWVQFNGSGTVTARASHELSSLTDNSTGNYTVNKTTAFSSANYSFATSVGEPTSTLYETANPAAAVPTTTAFRFEVYWIGNSSRDATYISVSLFGDE
jgi:hypothetical protein